jgi:hypothetical protein
VFISPDSKGENRHLLLGFPLLYSIYIIPDIPASIIQIRDPDINKNLILIQEPKFKEFISYNLILYLITT